MNNWNYFCDFFLGPQIDDGITCSRFPHANRCQKDWRGCWKRSCQAFVKARSETSLSFMAGNKRVVLPNNVAVHTQLSAWVKALPYFLGLDPRCDCCLFPWEAEKKSKIFVCTFTHKCIRATEWHCGTGGHRRQAAARGQNLRGKSKDLLLPGALPPPGGAHSPDTVTVPTWGCAPSLPIHHGNLVLCSARALRTEAIPFSCWYCPCAL